MSAPAESPRLYRDPRTRVFGGVAAGIAAHLGVSKALVRLAFVLLAFSTETGFLLYAAFWAVMPLPDNVQGARRRSHQIVPFLALGFGVFLMLRLSGAALSNRTYLGLLIALVAAGAGVIWHHSDPKARERWADSRPQAPWLAVVTERDRTAYILRFVGGGVARRRSGSSGWSRSSRPSWASISPPSATACSSRWSRSPGSDSRCAPVLWRMFEPAARGAGGPHPGAGAGRAGRDGARPGAAHAGADPAQRRATPPPWSAAGPRPGTHPAQLALQADRLADRALRRRAGAGRRGGRGHLRDHGGDGGGRRPARRRPGRPRWSPRPARRWSTRPGTPGSQTVSLYAEVEPEQVSVFVRDRGVGLRPGLRWRSTGTASAARSSGGCSGTAARRRSAPSRARAPRYG